MLDQDSQLSTSPFAIPREDVASLHANQSFTVLRDYLARDTACVSLLTTSIQFMVYELTRLSFCADHTTCDDATKQTWILHRDLLHALVMPVLSLFQRAATLAAAALCTHKSAELELAFSGEARGAFLCLQCFVDEEEDWCRTRGCPACITTETLSTESHLRLTIAASLLSTSTAAATPTAHSALSLPPLPHILPALRAALASDPFWGPDTWPYLLSRAEQLVTGLQALMSECVDLESLVSSPVARQAPPPPHLQHQHRSFTTPTLHIVGDNESSGVRLRKSKLAKRQLRLKNDEMELMRRVALQCWARAKMPGLARELGEGRRSRSLTCP